MELNLDLVKWFVNEREKIRLGGPTEDYVLNNSRFCNINREDDKVSKWIFKNCLRINQVAFARLVNRIDLLKTVASLQWSLPAYLELPGAKTNSGAYQFYPRKGETINTIINEIIGADLETIIPEITKGKSIKEASLAMSKYFGRPLHFYWMQVILDLGHMGLIDIDMNSEVYQGPGGEKVIKTIGMSINELSEELNYPPHIIEHICCEVRKYYDRSTKGIPNNRKRSA